jgi:amino acid adenylation domain-containing protein
MDVSSAGGERVPASFGQQRLWLIDQLEGAGAAYNVPLVIQIADDVDVQALERALDQLIVRHESLRTTFEMRGQDLLQVIPARQPISIVHVRDVPFGGIDDAAWRRAAASSAAAPFDLERGPLVRAVLFGSGRGRSVLLLTIHHIVFDGWSEGVLLRDLLALYEAERSARPAALPSLPLRYADYARWQRGTPDRAAWARDIAYWRGRLSHAPAGVNLPKDFGDRPSARFAGRSTSLGLGPELSGAVRDFGRRERVSVFPVLLAAFVEVLSTFTAQDDLIIGTPTSGRDRPELADLIGFFVNTVLLRLQRDPGRTGRDLLKHVHATSVEAFLHAECPFEEVMAELRRDRLDPPPIQVMFTLQHAPEGPWTDHGWRSIPFGPDGTAKFDLTCIVIDSQDEFRIVIEYSAFDEGTVRSFARAYVAALEHLVRTPDRAVGTWALTSPLDRRRLLDDWSGKAHASWDSGPELRIDARFDAIAARTPDRVAVVCGNVQATYRQLQERASRLAHRIRHAAAGQPAVVGVLTERSADYVAALVGILKAGAAYLPIEPGTPDARLDRMLADTGTRLVVGRCDPHRALRAQVTWVDPDGADAIGAVALPDSSRPASDLAYVMFTSGSTGTPKGVAVEHRSVTRLVVGQEFAALGPEERLLHLAPASFDASTFEIWGALLNGGCSVVAPNPQPTFRELADLIERHRVTTMWLTSSLFNLVIDEAPNALKPLKQLLVGGEALSVSHIQRALKRLPDTALVNGYGPTETTTFATTYRIPRELDECCRSIPIGRPIRGTVVYVLDRTGRLAPPGAPGELFIGGAGVAREYVARADETTAAFQTLQIDEALPPFRLYRTGDQVRWRSDGTLEFLGRTDHQVKIHGFRIELGEIEAAIRTHADVADTAVVARPGATGQLQLVAYVVSAGSPVSPASLQGHLRRQLPDYMVPVQILELPDLPRTETGKVDRRAFPDPIVAQAPAAGTPATGTERRLALIFQRLLKLSGVGPDDDFFRLGGHSLLAIQLFSEIEHEFDVRLPLLRLTRASKVRELADEIDAAAVAPSLSERVVLLRDGSPGRPIYIPFSVGGDLLYCRELVSHLDGTRRVLGLAPPPGADQGDMRALARALAPVILDVDDHGPHTLVGYSFSGMLAYETAVALAERGAKPGLVIVIDCGPGSPLSLRKLVSTPWHVLRNLPRWLREDILGTPLDSLIARLRRKVVASTGRVRRLARGRLDGDASLLFDDMYGGERVAEEYRSLVERHLHAFLTHRISRFRGAVALLRVRTRPLLHSFEPDLGWHSYVDGPVEIIDVPGHHDNILRPPQVGGLAERIDMLASRPW